MPAPKPTEKGAALLAAIERIVEPPEKIRSRVAAIAKRVRGSLPDDASETEVLLLVDRRLIADYSTRTAIAGGAAAVPAIVPGLGGLAAFLGGNLLDMTLCLKFEVELALALAAARGYRIDDPRERRLAYLLAAVHAYEASGGRNPLGDLVKAEVDAVWTYTPRQLAKLAAAVLVKLALLWAGKGLVRAVPFVGIAVSSAANKALTRRVGRAVAGALDRRKERSAPRRAPKRPGKSRRSAKAGGRRGRA